MVEPLVDMRDLTVTFTGGRKPVRAVNGVDLQVRAARRWR
jgi:peptide/nickel transport system ATP-binding protein